MRAGRTGAKGEHAIALSEINLRDVHLVVDRNVDRRYKGCIETEKTK